MYDYSINSLLYFDVVVVISVTSVSDFSELEALCEGKEFVPPSCRKKYRRDHQNGKLNLTIKKILQLIH